MKKFKNKISFKDKRGIISDLIENENINAVTLITIKKNSIRGNHFHKRTWQWNYVIQGKMQLITQKGNGKKISTTLNQGDLALVGPYEKHALVGKNFCKCIVFTKGPRGGKEYETDTFRLKKPLI